MPHKPDGKLVRGAKKDLAVNLGFDSGDIVSLWEKGKSQSYKNYLYEIAAKYDVSVEWLRGETDEKQKKTTDRWVDDLDDVEKQIMDLLLSLPNEQLKRELVYLRSLVDEGGQDK